MSSSGLIFVAIAIMWAAVLIPMWLRSHDSASENRSADRFGQAMRVLSRRSEDSAEEMEEREPAARESQTTTDKPQPQVPRQRPSLARRRTRTLAVLAGVTLLLGVVAGLGLLPRWAPLPAVLLLVGFVVHLRSQAKRSAALRTRRRTARIIPEPTVEAAPPRRRQAAVRERVERSTAEFVPGPSRAMVVETKGSSRLADPVQGHDAVEAHGSDQEWRPNPLPVPTYVTAPKAIRPIKVIDLTTPGAFSSGRLLDDGLPDEAMADEDLLAAEVASDELDALLEHEARGGPAVRSKESDGTRRAVGD